MNAALRLAVFAGGLLAVFAAATGLGRAVGPVGSAAGDSHAESGGHADAESGGHADDGHGGTDGHGAQAPGTAAPAMPTGLSASQDGYLLRLAEPVVAAGRPTQFGLTIEGPDGRIQRDFQVSHDKELHLIVARRDLAHFQHLHPVRDSAGNWTVSLTLAEPGPYKVFADFLPAGADKAVVLAADVMVAGDFQPVRHATPTAVAEIDDYTVTLQGALVPGQQSELRLSVARNGEPVVDLEPYLAAYGHLVALRASDLAYLHVHPEGEPGDGQTRPGPDITFFAHAPTKGIYRLFLDFRHAGVVRTAAFTVEAR